MSIYRLSGLVEQVDTRDGKSKATGDAYSIPYIDVRVDRFVKTSANVPDSMYELLRSKVGQSVDLVCEVTASGGYLRSAVMGFWPDSEDAADSIGYQRAS